MAISIHFVKKCPSLHRKISKKHEDGFTIFSKAAVKFTY